MIFLIFLFLKSHLFVLFSRQHICDITDVNIIPKTDACDKAFDYIVQGYTIDKTAFAGKTDSEINAILHDLVANPDPNKECVFNK